MDSQPGPSRERSPVVTRCKTLTDEQLLALLQESDVDDGDNDFKVDTEESNYRGKLLPKSEKTTKVQCKRCSYCKEIGKRKDTSYYCSLCPQNPPLCLGSCFENYHAK